MSGKPDRLFILEHAFDDPAFPGSTFYCRDCILIEGLLAMFPDRTTNLEVIRVPWPRPRPLVVEAIGEADQNLPALVFADGGFVNDIKPLLDALHVRHGFPEAHP
ncbi:MAG: DUF3088 family protein [Sphingopyxis sp.]|nr:DUF3088 family protein [Sphingopyxis sp.]